MKTIAADGVRELRVRRGQRVQCIMFFFVEAARAHSPPAITAKPPGVIMVGSKPPYNIFFGIY